MWNKTFAGLICGLIFVLLAPSAFSLIFTRHISLMLALTVVIVLSAWAGIMTWCYAAKNGKTAWLRGSYFAVGSILFYFSIYFTLGVPE